MYICGMKNRVCLFLCLLALAGCMALQAQSVAELAQEGDLIFQELPCGELCDNIARVTPSKPGFRFQHAGLVLKEGNALYVVESIGHGVQKTPLDSFLWRGRRRYLANDGVALARFKPKGMQKRSAAAARMALEYLGAPYDDAFLPDGNALYCTELIQMVYRRNGLGKQIPSAPMTFKDPATGETFPGWKNYYESMAMAVPEGLPGTNPGRLSLNKKLRFLFPERAVLSR